MPGGVSLLLATLEFGLLVAAAWRALYRYVPNTDVSWRHAWAGGLFVAIGFEVAKRGLAWYVGLVPTYLGDLRRLRHVADLPAVDLPELGRRAAGRGDRRLCAEPADARGATGRRPGYRFALAVALLRELQRARAAPQKGLSIARVAAGGCDPLQVEPVLESCCAGLGGAARRRRRARHVLLADPPPRAPPLIDALLLEPTPPTQAFRQHAGLGRLTLAELIGA